LSNNFENTGGIYYIIGRISARNGRAGGELGNNKIMPINKERSKK